MDWSEIDLNARRWTLPADRAKNDQEHVIPLTGLALAELQMLGPKRKGLVFTTTGTTPVSGFFKGRAALHKDIRRRDPARSSADLIQHRLDRSGYCRNIVTTCLVARASFA